jgi:hypothetical protein
LIYSIAEAAAGCAAKPNYGKGDALNSHQISDALFHEQDNDWVDRRWGFF